MDVENIQHSSGTSTTVPHISPIFPGAVNNNNNNNNHNNDTWSLSYAPSEDISSATTVDRPLATGEPVPEQPKYANLGPPGYSDNAIDDKSPLRSPPAPSPQVSALGSTNQDDIPSRSVSEVTRPDEQILDPSPTGSDPQQRAPGRADSGAGASRLSSPAPRCPREHHLSSSPAADATVPSVDQRRLLEVFGDESNDPPQIASFGSNYSQPAAVLPLARRSSDRKSQTEEKEVSNESVGHDLEHGRSEVSAVFGPSPGPPISDHDGLLSQENFDGKESKLPASASAPAVSPPYEELTPPYSAVMNTKDAEAASEKSLETSQGGRQSPPAYQSPVQEKAPPFPFQPSAIVPVADLTARKREEEKCPPTRPFSFMDTNQEDILHRHTPSKESQHTSGVGSPLSKELGLDVNVTGDCPYSRSFPRPFSDADSGQHVALRGLLSDQPLLSQNGNYIPPQGPAKQSSPLTTPMPSEQQYRIPGPYGQQFRFPKSTLSPQNVGQPSAQGPSHPAPLAAREQAADHPAMSNRRHRGSDVAALPRLSTTEYSLPGIGPPLPPETSASTPKVRGTAATMFRPRSRSRPRATNGDDSDGQEHYHIEAKKREGRGDLFRPRSRQDTDSTSDQYGSTIADTGGSQNGFNLGQPSPKVRNEVSANAQDHRSPVKLQRASTSNAASQGEGKKKKGGFLRLGRLFGKPGKESSPPGKKEFVQRAVSLSSPPPPRPSGPASSVPYEKQQGLQRDQDHARGYDDQRDNFFRGQAPPVGGYYAPASQPPEPGEYQPQPMRRDPDGFIGGHRLSGQRAAEQARYLENLSAKRNQRLAEKPYPLPPPQLSSKGQPQSAPPTTQRFDHGQTRQPRAASQRSPPDLRIDTSVRLNPHRRSQPLPLGGTSSNLDSNINRDRTAQPQTAFTNRRIPTHSNSNPQRHSPYTDGTSPHSPYGYGSARGLRKDQLSHTIDLHKRSRSPRNGRHDSYDSPEDSIINAQDPAHILGTFSETHRSRSQRGGESAQDNDNNNDDSQEKPWKIDLPIADDGNHHAPRVGVGAGSAATGAAGPGQQRTPLSSAPGNARVLVACPVELPGSKAPGDTDSDEEIIMCSTAYPGQEWMPDMHGHGHLDD
jgi:hypothetical protein